VFCRRSSAWITSGRIDAAARQVELPLNCRLGKADAGETDRFPKDSKRRMRFSIVRFVDRDDGVEALRGFFVVPLAKQVYIMCLCVTGEVPPTGRGCLYIGIPH
jgi:hypothetical protein